MLLWVASSASWKPAGLHWSLSTPHSSVSPGAVTPGPPGRVQPCAGWFQAGLPSNRSGENPVNRWPLAYLAPTLEPKVPENKGSSDLPTDLMWCRMDRTPFPGPIRWAGTPTPIGSPFITSFCCGPLSSGHVCVHTHACTCLQASAHLLLNTQNFLKYFISFISSFHFNSHNDSKR